MEDERGCGWRKVGGAYLVGSGISGVCDALPIPLEPCSECDYVIPFSRAMQKIHIGYLASKLRDHVCHDTFLGCPICHYAREKRIPHFYVMWVSKRYYTPASFIQEAIRLGVSKRIAPQSLPKGFQIGTDWVYLAHKETPLVYETGSLIPDKMGNAIFYAFKPRRIELLLWSDTDKATVATWKQKGFTVILIERTKENLAKHG